jgi:hypothetical protein
MSSISGHVKLTLKAYNKNARKRIRMNPKESLKHLEKERRKPFPSSST